MPVGSMPSTKQAAAQPTRRQTVRARLIKGCVSIHRALPWFAGLALLLWGLSGMTHVLMSAFGPQQATFLPPQRALDLDGAQPLHRTLEAAGIGRAQAVRVVVAEGEHLLQVTEEQGQPRRYFRLSDGSERRQHDRQQAEFVARHFLGAAVQDAAVTGQDFVTEFSSHYPAVNRLLPVWRISFDTPDRLTAYVYTETNALAAVSNDFNRVLQRLFQWFHTFSWVPEAGEWLRVLLVSLLILSLLLVASTGVGMLLLIRRRQRAPGQRGVHRLAAYFFALPVLMFASSGLWHLLHSSANPPQHHLLMSPPMTLDGVRFGLHEQWSEIAEGLPVNDLSIVQYDEGVYLYRLGLAAPRAGVPQGDRAIRHARFDGVRPTGPALYLDAASGEAWPQGDRELALRLGERFSGLDRDRIDHMELLTRFGAGYDFRNKRLPVWRLDYGAPLNASIFVDTATGVQADRAMAGDRLERLSFTYLHKWNFLRPLGRDGQNLIIALAVLGSVLLMAGFGLRMAFSRGRR